MAAELNRGQQTVVASDARRIVVSAGAGSGKTRTLVERFVDRVLRMENAGVPSPMRSILLITFTEKAAGELIERVRGRLLERGRPDLAREVDNSWISTIHGFCNRIARRHALELGIDPAFSVLGETEAGLARSAAFESAATSLVDDEDVRDLLGTWQIATLRGSVLRGYDTLRAMGLGASDVDPCAPGDLRGALEAFLEVTDRLLPEYRGCGASATVLDNTDLFDSKACAASQALALLSEGCDSDDPAVSVPLDAVLEGKGARRGSERAKEIVAEINDAVDRVRGALIDTQAARQSAAWSRLLVAFDASYGAAKSARGALDFEDMQLLTRRLWTENPEAAQRYREQFLEVMIDEFQDTNRLQVEATEPVIGLRACYVGDVQQSIYGFRDADVTLLRALFSSAESGSDGEACRLTVNYRTHPGVLAPINALFAHPALLGNGHQLLEHEVEPPTSVQWPAGESRVEVIVADKSTCEPGEWRRVEARALAERLRAIVDEGRAKAGDIVVLTRATTTMNVYVAALVDAGFEVLAPAAGGFYGTREVADARALLKVLANPLDTEGVVGLLAGGLGGLSDDALFLLAEAGRERDQWGALGDPYEIGLSSPDAERASLIHATVQRLRTMQGRIRLADALLHAAAVLGPGGGLLSDPSGWPNLQKVVRLAAEYELTTPADPAAFLRYLAEREEYVAKEAVGGTAIEGPDAVRMMTVHAAKGLEFPIVAVADLGHGSINAAADVLLSERDRKVTAAARGPQELRSKSVPGSTCWQAAASTAREADSDEESRVFYVACTRAEQALFLSGGFDTTKEPAGPLMIERVLQAIGEGRDGIAVSVVRGDTPPAIESRGSASGTSSRTADGRAEGSKRSPVSAGSLEPLPEPVPIAPPREMSYTAFALYESCAYRFFAERMLKVGSVVAPREDDPLAFGSTLHAALELVSRGEHVDDERLAQLVRAAGLPSKDANRLKDAVESVRSSDVGILVAAGIPEVDFALRVGEAVLRGSMDLLISDGSGATVLDYKTGTSGNADAGRYEAQAEVYAFALLEEGAARVEVRFVHVENGCEQVTFAFTPADAPRIRARLESALARMAAGEFPRLGAFHELYCVDCPVSGGLCPVVHPGRQDGPRSTARRSGQVRDLAD